jgi:cell division protein FtsB
VKRLHELARTLLQSRRLLASAALALLAIALFAHILLGSNGWLTYRQKRAEYQRLEAELRRIDEDNRRLEGQIKALKSDPKAIEKEAREQLRYAKPGEVIYLLPEQPGSHPAPGAPQAEGEGR